MNLLHPGDPFPDIDLHLVNGDNPNVLEILSGGPGIVLLNRGSWCPFCNVQLRGFQRAATELEHLGATVVSMSVDDRATTQELIDKHKLGFPVGHSADAHKVSELTGAFVNPDPSYLQATGFVLDHQGKVIVSAYSSGAIGRLVAEDVVGLLRYIKHGAAQ